MTASSSGALTIGDGRDSPRRDDADQQPQDQRGAAVHAPLIDGHLRLSDPLVAYVCIGQSAQRVLTRDDELAQSDRTGAVPSTYRRGHACLRCVASAASSRNSKPPIDRAPQNAAKEGPWPCDPDVAAGRHAGSIWGGNRLDRAWSRAAPAPCLAVGTEGFLCSLPACSPRSAAVRGGSGVRGGGGALALADRSSSATSFFWGRQVRCLIARVGSVFVPE